MLSIYGCTVHICLTPARSRSGRVPDAKTGFELVEELYRQAFRHDVRELMRRWDMKHAYLSKGNLLTDEVNIDLDVFGAAVVNGIGCHVDSTHVVAVDDRRRSNRHMEFLKKLPQPAALSNSVGHCPVLSLRAGPGDGSLSLGGPRDEVIAEVDAVARSGATGVRTPSPVRIRVSGERLDVADAQVKTGGKRALQVAQDPFEQGQMWLARVMHEKAHLLNRVCQIRSSQRDVLESTDDAPVHGRVGDWSTSSRGELGMSVDRGRRGVTLGHACTLKKVDGVLSLGQEDPGGEALDGDVEEVVEIPKICHGELGVEPVDDALEKS